VIKKMAKKARLPAVPASKAQGQTMEGQDGQTYRSERNPKTKRWRWTLLPGVQSEPEVDTSPSGTDTSDSEGEMEKPRNESKGSSAERMRQWRLMPTPQKLSDLPTMTPALEAKLKAQGVTQLGALYAKVFSTRGDFVKFAREMKTLGLDELSTQLMFDKFAGQLAMDVDFKQPEPEVASLLLL
jgi:hypothetical protein